MFPDNDRAVLFGVGAALLLVGFAGVGLATTGTDAGDQASIPEAEAVSIAENETNGTAQEVELETEDGPVYEIEVEQADGTLKEVEIDGESGDVLEVETEEDEYEDEEEYDDDEEDEEEYDDDDVEEAEY